MIFFLIHHVPPGKLCYLIELNFVKICSVEVNSSFGNFSIAPDLVDDKALPVRTTQTSLIEKLRSFFLHIDADSPASDQSR